MAKDHDNDSDYINYNIKHPKLNTISKYWAWKK